jgi:trimeric autotransporter adhesin
MVLFVLFVSSALALLAFQRRFLHIRRPAGSMVLWLAAVMALTGSGTTASAITRPRTIVSLAVTSGGSTVTSVTSGSVVTLTAVVHEATGGAVVTTGQVEFCDASAKVCTDIHLLGTAQLTSAGTATLKFRPGIGSHSYDAVFLPSGVEGRGASSPATLTVTGTHATTTTLEQNGLPGNYTLTATVAV